MGGRASSSLNEIQDDGRAPRAVLLRVAVIDQIVVSKTPAAA